MTRPIIGITGELEAARWGNWVREAVVSPVTYTRAVERVGGAPVVLPPVPSASVPALIECVDGLLFTGGRDVDPALYDETRAEETDAPDHRRDRFELALMRAAIEADLPFLAVCRGLHVLNVARGGTLIQHLPDKLGHDAHKPDPVKLTLHQITLSAESRLGRLLGGSITPLAGHHQGLNRVGTGLLEVGWATKDQLVEAVELTGHKFGFGVQWHPQEGDNQNLIGALIEAADRTKTAASTSKRGSVAAKPVALKPAKRR
jgi:putative glutamine amidotransferase